MRISFIAVLTTLSCLTGCGGQDQPAVEQPSPPSYSLAVHCAALGYVIEKHVSDPKSVNLVRNKAKVLALRSAEQVGKGPNDVENDIATLATSKFGALSGAVFAAPNDSTESVSASLGSAIDGMVSEFNQICTPIF